MKNLEEKGITLVALVVTIIILLILAGVTITLALGEGGILNKAKGAVDKTKQSIANDQSDIAKLTNQIEDILGGSSREDPSTPPKKLSPLAQAAEDETKFNKNTPLTDEYGNSVTIPKDFHIVTPKEDNTVVYEYSETNPGTPTVQDGVVIEDENDNQFVWIPIGNVKNRNGSTTEIKLARRVFDIDIIKNENSYEIIGGTGKVKTTIEDGSELTDETANLWYQEETKFTEDTIDSHNSSYNNSIAKNIEAFKSSAINNGGYYLARYEASYSDGIKPYSRPSVGDPASGSSAPSTRSERQLWNWITQPQAANAAQNMYNENNNYTSDLVNSYAWDTAIYFIQTYSRETAYSIKNYSSSKSSPVNTGERGESTDKVCNIYDMASNCFEWTTETYHSSKTQYCVSRGSEYLNIWSYTSGRGGGSFNGRGSHGSFRVTLYVD